MCELSKHRRASLPTYSQTRSNKAFDIIHSDVWGPLNVSNQYHFKYYVLFVDDYNHISWLYLMKDRSKIFSKFMSFMNEIKDSTFYNLSLSI